MKEIKVEIVRHSLVKDSLRTLGNHADNSLMAIF
jgi:hypothetical protein